MEKTSSEVVATEKGSESSGERPRGHENVLELVNWLLIVVRKLLAVIEKGCCLSGVVVVNTAVEELGIAEQP
ncbi:hypothetical protein M0R45_031076 [Rubus argutus]|uniref:Uncharacterized protein n=1 Tax=Rubus argutus TaxID=59490 RepID=A0AAW1WGF4_RUBAR